MENCGSISPVFLYNSRRDIAVQRFAREKLVVGVGKAGD